MTLYKHEKQEREIESRLDKYLKPRYRVVEEIKDHQLDFVKVRSRDLYFLINTIDLKLEYEFSRGYSNINVYFAFDVFFDSYIKDDEHGLYYGRKENIQEVLNSKAEKLAWLLKNFSDVHDEVNTQLKKGGFDFYENVANGKQTRSEYENLMKQAFETTINDMEVPLKFLFVKG